MMALMDQLPNFALPVKIRSFRDLIEIAPVDRLRRTVAVLPMRVAYHGSKNGDPRAVNNARIILSALPIQLALTVILSEHELGKPYSISLLKNVLAGTPIAAPEDELFSPGPWTWNHSHHLISGYGVIAVVGDPNEDAKNPACPSDIPFVQWLAIAPDLRRCATHLLITLLDVDAHISLPISVWQEIRALLFIGQNCWSVGESEKRDIDMPFGSTAFGTCFSSIRTLHG